MIAKDIFLKKLCFLFLQNECNLIFEFYINNDEKKDKIRLNEVRCIEKHKEIRDTQGQNLVTLSFLVKSLHIRFINIWNT